MATDSPQDPIHAWWDQLTPRQREQIFYYRWRPLPPWASDSLASAGLPPTAGTFLGEPCRHLPADVQLFLDYTAATADVPARAADL